MGISFTDDDSANELYNTDFNALVIALLLDQQIPITWAFMGPGRLAERLGHLDVAKIATMDTDALVELACTKPAIHRYPAAMARRIQELCVALVEQYSGDAETIWNDGASATVVAQRLGELPGYGPEKVKIFVAILGKRFNIKPSGWKKVAKPFSDSQPRSVADAGSKSLYEEVKIWKKSQRAAGKSKQD